MEYQFAKALDKMTQNAGNQVLLMLPEMVNLRWTVHMISNKRLDKIIIWDP